MPRERMERLSSSIRHIGRAFPTMLSTGIAETVAYRAEFVIWILTSVMPLIMLALWDTVARGGPISGFDRIDFARYYTVTLVTRQLTACWVVWTLNHEIRTGALSPLLLRPMNPIVLHSARNLAAIPLRLLVLVPVVGALVWWRPDMGLSFEPWRVVCFVWAAGVAWCTAFLFQATLGCLAFWFDQSLGIFNVWYFLWSLLGGYMFPLSLLPGVLQDATRWLPFRSMLGLPVEIGAGLLDLRATLPALAIQLGWCAISWLACTATWRLGIRRYGAFGA